MLVHWTLRGPIQLTLSGQAVGPLEELQIKKHRIVSNSPLRPEDTHLGRQPNFACGLKFTDVINCAKFHLHWLSRFWAEPLGSENPNLPFVWVTAFTIVYALTCYTKGVQPSGYGGPDWFHPWCGGPVCNIGRCHGDVWMWTLITW